MRFYELILHLLLFLNRFNLTHFLFFFSPMLFYLLKMTRLSAFFANFMLPFLAVKTVRQTSKSPKPMSDNSHAFSKISDSSKPSGSYTESIIPT